MQLMPTACVIINKCNDLKIVHMCYLYQLIVVWRSPPNWWMGSSHNWPHDRIASLRFARRCRRGSRRAGSRPWSPWWRPRPPPPRPPRCGTGWCRRRHEQCSASTGSPPTSTHPSTHTSWWVDTLQAKVFSQNKILYLQCFRCPGKTWLQGSQRRPTGDRDAWLNLLMKYLLCLCNTAIPLIFGNWDW